MLTLTDIQSWLSALTWSFHEIMLQTALFLVGWLMGDGEMSDVWLRFVAGMARLHNTELFTIWYRRILVTRPRGSCDISENLAANVEGVRSFTVVLTQQFGFFSVFYCLNSAPITLFLSAPCLPLSSLTVPLFV